MVRPRLLLVAWLGLAARGATPSAFERRCIPAGCVAPPSNIPDILSRRALPTGRLAVLGATMDLHHEPLATNTLTTSAAVRRSVLFGAWAITVGLGLAFIFVKAPHPWGWEGFDN